MSPINIVIIAVRTVPLPVVQHGINGDHSCSYIGMYRIAIFKIRPEPEPEPDICNVVKPSQLTVIQYESKIRN